MLKFSQRESILILVLLGGLLAGNAITIYRLLYKEHSVNSQTNEKFRIYEQKIKDILNEANYSEELSINKIPIINLNEATKKELQKLPYIGAVIAGRIIEYRKSNGKFHHIDELINIKGIGNKKLAKIRPYIIIIN